MEQATKGRRLILFPLPFQGHLNSMLELANILHSKGFSITIIHTKFNSLNPSSHPHFTFHSISDGLSESEASMKNVFELFSILNVKCVEPFKECLASLLSDDDVNNPIACLISDTIFHFTRPIAESLNLPRLVLKTEGISFFNVCAAFPFLLEKGYLPIQDSRLNEPVKELPPLKVKDIPMVKGCDPEKYFNEVVALSTKTQASDGVIFNSFEELEETSLANTRQEYLPNIPIFPIGPFHKYIPATSSSSSSSSSLSHDISWLDTQAPKSVIYASFGSIATKNEAQFLEIAWGLANSKQPFLWVVRPNSIHGSEGHELLPSGFIEALNGRSRIVKWAPQKEVLAHPAVGGFLTHNGWNSTFESICEGVPMICMPSAGDQMINARYVSDAWKVGLQLEDGTERSEIAKAIRKLIVEKEGEVIRERALKLKEKANLCLKLGGSSYQSLDGLIKHILSFKPHGFQTLSQ